MRALPLTLSKRFDSMNEKEGTLGEIGWEARQAMKPGILIISHGSKESGWVSLVDEAVSSARQAWGEEVLVAAGFLELVEGRLIQDAIDELERAGADRLLAIPLFISSGSTHVSEIGWALGAYEEPGTETDLTPVACSVPLLYGKPMDDDAEVVDVLLERLQALSVRPDKESLLLIGHGSKEEGFRQAWERGLARLSEKLIEQGGFGDCRWAMLQLDQVGGRWEELRSDKPQNDIVVVPLFLSEGYFTKEVIPSLLRGLPSRYDGRTLMPHVRVLDWMSRQAGNWLNDIGFKRQL